MIIPKTPQQINSPIKTVKAKYESNPSNPYAYLKINGTIIVFDMIGGITEK